MSEGSIRTKNVCARVEVSLDHQSDDRSRRLCLHGALQWLCAIVWRLSVVLLAPVSTTTNDTFVRFRLLAHPSRYVLGVAILLGYISLLPFVRRGTLGRRCLHLGASLSSSVHFAREMLRHPWLGLHRLKGCPARPLRLWRT